MSASQLGVVVGSHELYSEDPDQESFAVREVKKNSKILVSMADSTMEFQIQGETARGLRPQYNHQ